MRENITDTIDGLTVFPDPRDVFVEDQSELARYLDPLVTIDLALVNPQWHGNVHLVSPVEPVDGHIGEFTEEHWTDVVRENWLAFSVEEDGRYRFLTDLQYFRLAQLGADPRVQGFPARVNPPAPEDAHEFHRARKIYETWAELRAHYDEQQASYDAAKAHFAEHGTLCRVPLAAPHRHDGLAILDRLGGTCDALGNWVEAVDYPMDIVESDDGSETAWPVSPAGDRFELVAAVPGWHYRRSGADSILLFFEPRSRTALITFDWS